MPGQSTGGVGRRLEETQCIKHDDKEDSFLPTKKMQIFKKMMTNIECSAFKMTLTNPNLPIRSETVPKRLHLQDDAGTENKVEKIVNVEVKGKPSRQTKKKKQGCICLCRWFW